MRVPHWPLPQVKELAADGRIFIQRTRALAFFDTLNAAMVVAREVIDGLSEMSFAHSTQMTWDVADVYGVRLKEHGWYLKIAIDEAEPELAVISFHPLERPLKTNGGVVQP